MLRGIGRLRARAASAPAVAPSTSTYTLAQSNAWTLELDSARDATKLYGVATGRNSRATVWAGYITGTDAGIAANSGFGQNSSLVEVSIDGAAFVAQNASAGYYPIFTGLSHARRLVALRYNSTFSDQPWVPTSGTLMSVTGAPPSIEIPTFLQPGDAGSLAAHIGNSLVTLSDGVYNSPVKYVNDDYFWVGANNPSIRLKCDYTSMVVACYGRYVAYSVDAGAPTYIDRGAVGWGAAAITGLSGTHTYNVWSSEGSMLAVGGLGGTGLASITKKYLDQYGDSITEGAAASSRAHIDTFRVAAALGYCAQNFGKSGDQTSNLETRLTNGSSSLLSGKTITSSDVAVMAIGRNDVTSFTGSVMTSYANCVTALLNKGYGKVVCRGILPDGSTGPWTSQNATIASYVSGLADARVVYCNTDSWTDIAYPGAGDFTHPTDAGYITLAGHAQTAYAALGV